MTETSERKTFEKKVLPDGKPILMTLSKAPREGKPSTFQGQEKAMIGFMFRVTDNKYMELVGYPVFVRTGAWISGGDNGGRESNTHKLLEKMAGEKLPADWDRIDARDISEEDWHPFFGDYVVRMKAPQLDDAGLLRWQDVDEVINPAAIEFPVEYRKAEAQGRAVAGPLGLPKGNQTPAKAEDKPQAPPETPPVPTKEETPARELTAAEVGYLIQEFIARKQGYGTIAKALLAQREAPGMSALSEDDTRLLLVRMQIEEQFRTSEKAAGFILDDLKHYETSIEALALPEARRLLNAAIAAANAPF